MESLLVSSACSTFSPILSPHKLALTAKPFFARAAARFPFLVHASQHVNAPPSMAVDKAKEKEAKLWGGRFEESVTDAVEKFTESISFDKALYKHDIMGSRAHASMLAAQVRTFHFSKRCIFLTFSFFEFKLSNFRLYFFFA